MVSCSEMKNASTENAAAFISEYDKLQGVEKMVELCGVQRVLLPARGLCKLYDFWHF